MRQMLLRRGLALEYVTLGWNVVGSMILLVSAAAVGSIALAGFGIDSLIEIVASAVVVWQLKGQDKSRRERRALRIIAIAFLLLAIYIAVQIIVTLSSHSHPGHSALGMAWLAATVVAMFALAAAKRDTGQRLGNPVLQTEAGVTLIDGALAAAVLAGVVLNAALGWWWADPRSRRSSSSSTPFARHGMRGLPIRGALQSSIHPHEQRRRAPASIERESQAALASISMPALRLATPPTSSPWTRTRFCERTRAVSVRCVCRCCWCGWGSGWHLPIEPWVSAEHRGRDAILARVSVLLVGRMLQVGLDGDCGLEEGRLLGGGRS